MSLIDWRDEFSTGISGIDYEHEELISSINDLHDSLGNQPDKQDIINSLNDIYGAIYSHFVLEERLMEKYGYDHYVEHCSDHERLLDEIREITEELDKTSEFNEQLLKKRLDDWFSVHFRTHDARLHKLEAAIQKNQKAGSIVAKLFGGTKDKNTTGK